MPDSPPFCNTCEQIRQLCFCDAPRTKELYEKRLRWAIIEHPASEDMGKKIDRMLAEPQKWLDFAKQLERELTAMNEEAFNRMVERNLRDR